MLVRDTLTGYLHEIPDGQTYGSSFSGYGHFYRPYTGAHYRSYGEPQIVYDGLGNPVGILPFIAALAPLAAKAAAAIAPVAAKAASAIIPTIAKALPGVSSLFPKVASLGTKALPMSTQAASLLPLTALPLMRRASLTPPQAPAPAEPVQTTVTVPMPTGPAMGPMAPAMMRPAAAAPYPQVQVIYRRRRRRRSRVRPPRTVAQPREPAASGEGRTGYAGYSSFYGPRW